MISVRALIQMLTRTRGKWLKMHDATKYAEENYARCAAHIIHGGEFHNTNVPVGYKYSAWTVKELMEISDTGKPIKDEGDWS